MLYFNKTHIYFKQNRKDKINNLSAVSIQLEQSRQSSLRAVQQPTPMTMATCSSSLLANTHAFICIIAHTDPFAWTACFLSHCPGNYYIIF